MHADLLACHLREAKTEGHMKGERTVEGDGSTTRDDNGQASTAEGRRATPSAYASGQGRSNTKCICERRRGEKHQMARLAALEARFTHKQIVAKLDVCILQLHDPLHISMPGRDASQGRVDKAKG